MTRGIGKESAEYLMGVVGEFPNAASRDPREIARFLCVAHQAGVEVDLRRLDDKLCGLALNWLIEESRLDVATFAAPLAAAAYPDSRFLTSLAKLLDSLPPPCEDAAFASFRDDGAQEVQVVARAGADAVLLGFCGRARKMGMPLNLIHRWLGMLGVHVVYLRDFLGANYDGGIRSLASDLRGTLHALEAIMSGLGARRMVCYGNSLGCYGALRYALELGSEAVLCFAGPTNLSPDFGNAVLRDQRGVGPGIDLRPLYEAADKAPRTHIVYPEHHAADRAQAQNFANLPTVSLEATPGAFRHDVVVHTVLQGRYERLTRWLVDPHRAAVP